MLLFALLTRLSYPPFDLAPLAAVAFWPLAARWEGRPRAPAAVFGGVFLSHLALVPWLSHFWGPAPLLVAAAVALYHLPAGFALARGRWVLSALLWAAGDLLLLHGPLPYPWGLLGQAAAPLAGIRLGARTLGVVGLSFAFALWGLAFARARGRGRGALLLLAFLAEAGGRMRSAPPASPLPVALVEPSFGLKDEPLRSPAARRFLEEATVFAARRGADPGGGAGLVVWSETILLDDIDENATLRAWVSGVAKENRVHLLVGVPDLDGEMKYNAAVLFDADGRVSGRYRKVILVPFGEYVPFFTPASLRKKYPAGTGDFDAAETAALLPSPWGKIGALICYEDLFGFHACALRENGAEFLVNLANDGWSNSRVAEEQHASFARLTAIEAGIPLLRCTNTGRSLAYDASGREIPVLVVRPADLTPRILMPPESE